MTPICIETEQGSDHWHGLRNCRITSSEVHRAVRGHKSYAKSLRAALAGEPPYVFDAASVAWGRQAEPMAIAGYELRTGQETRKAGFYIHPEIDFLGGSPDPIVIGGKGFTEVKCPYVASNHDLVVFNKTIPEKHKPQIQMNLLLTGMEWCDFISFDPRQAFPRELIIIRMHSDPVYQQMLVAACQKFWIEQVLQAEPDKTADLDEIPSLF